jgi:hypothetical protein
MTTNANTTFRQYLGTWDDDGKPVIRLRTHKGQAYAKARIIARFDSYDDMLAAWDRCTMLEGMTDVIVND